MHVTRTADVRRPAILSYHAAGNREEGRYGLWRFLDASISDTNIDKGYPDRSAFLLLSFDPAG